MVSVQGNVEVRRAGQTQWQQARLNDFYCAGDRIQVGERSRADVALANQPILRLDQNSTINLAGIKEQRTGLVELLAGALYFFSRLPRNLEIQTPFVNAGVEGTEGLVAVEANRTLISIFEGRVRAENQFGNVSLAGGQSAIAEQGGAPVITLVARPRDAVQWAIYYAPTLYFRAADFPAGLGWEGMVRNSIEAYMKGDMPAAFDRIAGVPANLNEPRFFVYRASLLLAIGRYDEGTRDLERALSLRPNYSDALALQTVIAVVQNDKERALNVGKQAITADPKSAAAAIALSYAQQANFDLNGALSSLQQAVQLEPENALAWARLAELQLSLSRLEEALEAAQKAVAIDPNLSRTQTILGFAYLIRVDTGAAKTAFERAIELDQGDGLPRLGLGLAKIREGDLAEGRMELDVAVSLDPDNALFRSYLGKAYYEEKRDKQASDQYETAKQLDPKDPTPYFYNSILKETQNRPVEALRELERSIELNDNRAIYRSRLPLDQDLATRSANIGRIYRDLGFEKLALVEGWKSISADPSDYSGHRLLADNYLTLPRHEIARDSELLVSQLLQPLNLNPVQPRLLSDRLLFLDNFKPSFAGLNEYSPLFVGNQLRLFLDGVAGNKDTFGDNVIASGIYKNVSASFGQSHFRSNGFRKNNDITQDIYNAFAQAELNPRISIQMEFRSNDLNQGDRFLLFDRNNFFDPFDETFKTRTVRGGFRYGITPDQTLIGSYFYRELTDEIDSSPLGISVKERAHFPEFRYFYRNNDWFKLTAGFGNFFGTAREKTFFFSFLDSASSTDLMHHNFYSYTYIEPLRNLTLTLGLSGDILRTEVVDRNQVNPKVGLLWNFDNEFGGAKLNTTIRGGALRTVKRLVVSNQTLEPTQVAGFNQFFDDINGTKSWRSGIGLDHKISFSNPFLSLGDESRTIYLGAEFTKRDMSVPKIITQPTRHTIEVDEDERIARTYAYWTPFKSLGIGAEYSFEKLGRDPLAQNAEALVKSTTHRVPLSLRFFDPSGVFAMGKATYVDQSGRFQFSSGDIQSGHDRFWVYDASIGYRLPRRWGTLSVDALNLFDSKFRFQDIDPQNSTIAPGRLVMFRASFSLDHLWLRF
jgi:tetratricopeptide (TPR) repeat protein